MMYLHVYVCVRVGHSKTLAKFGLGFGFVLVLLASPRPERRQRIPGASCGIRVIRQIFRALHTSNFKFCRGCVSCTRLAHL